jgi:DNA-binding GntR family transcriptional regulator
MPPDFALTDISLSGDRSRAQELYGYLRSAILSGRLRPGERLVENKLAELANVSRTPVREALHRLHIDGLVCESAQGGFEVSGVSLQELIDACAVRETLEGMATGLAATNRSDIDLAILRNTIRDEEQAMREGAEGAVHVSLNHVFHQTIWRASRNSYLIAQLDALRELIERLQDTTLARRERQQHALDEHAAIVDALEARDVVAAEMVARQHFRNAMAERISMIAQQPAGQRPAQ